MTTDSVDLCVRGGVVLVPGGEPSALPADVYVTAGRIVSVGGTARPAREVLDASGMVVFPGMHNLHDHLRDLTPGAFEGLRLDDLLRRMWAFNEHADPAEYRLGAALGAARLLKAGVTSVVDHVYPFHRPGLAEATVEGYAECGIRWFLARGIMTVGHPPICEEQGQALKEIRRLADAVVPRDRLLVAPVSFRQATTDDYRAARRLADELGLRLYTHVAETSAEVDETLANHGARPIELLHTLGFVGADSILVHCVLPSQTEMDLLAGGEAHVVHCPSNHMKLAKGVTPVPALLDAGVNVCLGVDMQGGDLLAEVRQEMLLQGLANADPSAVSPVTALDMATIRGARALGLGSELGTIEPGRRADLICLDQRDLAVQPVLDPLWTVANRATAQHVRHVIVDGEVMVRDGGLCRVDEQALYAEVRDVTAAYLRRTGSNLPGPS